MLRTVDKFVRNVSHFRFRFKVQLNSYYFCFSESSNFFIEIPGKEYVKWLRLYITFKMFSFICAVVATLYLNNILAIKGRFC